MHWPSAPGKRVWDWDIHTGVIYLDPSLKALLGYGDDEISNQLEAWGWPCAS